MRALLVALGLWAMLTQPGFAQTQSDARTPDFRPQFSAAPLPPPILLSKSQRAGIAAELKAKWQAAANARPGGGARWTQMLSHVVSTADAEFVLRATTALTLEEVHKALAGGDIARKASSDETSGELGNGVGSQAILGSTTNTDLVYTPLPYGRCRIFDTRKLGAPLVGSRNVLIEDMTSYTSQGGTGSFANGNSSAACGIPTYSGAYVLSVILNSPSSDGPVKVFPFNRPAAEGNTVIMNGGTYGSGGDITVRSCVGCAAEIGISSGTSVHVAIDVIGYFRYAQLPTYRPPTPGCYYTSDGRTTLAANGYGEVSAPACATGYTRVSTACWMDHYIANLSGSLEGRCWGSTGNFASAVNARNTCCYLAGK